MSIIRDKVVTHDIALKLIEVGFNEPCIFEYNSYGSLKVNVDRTNPDKDDECSNDEHHSRLKAPLWVDVIDWFREKHSIEIEIIPVYYNKLYHVFVDNYIFDEDDDISRIKEFIYVDAREIGILKALEILIEKNKNE